MPRCKACKSKNAEIKYLKNLIKQYKNYTRWLIEQLPKPKGTIQLTMFSPHDDLDDY